MASSLPVPSSAKLSPADDAGMLQSESKHDEVLAPIPAAFQRQQPSTVVSPSSMLTTTTSTSAPPRDDNRSVTTSTSGRTIGTVQRQKLIVFSTPAQYGPIFSAVHLVPLVVMVARIIILHPRLHGQDDRGVDNDDNDISRSVQGWILAWQVVILLVVYMVVLPKQIDVRSNGTVGIKSFLFTYHIDDIVRAYQTGMGRNDYLRPRISFATRFGDGTRVVLRRRHGKWDVTVSPTDPVGFVHAVEEVVRGDDGVVVVDDAVDYDGDVDIVGTGPSSLHKGTKPDLASTSAEVV
jgi:hypothetical protein